MSGYLNKSVFMLQIKGGMKNGGELRLQNCFYLGTLKFLAYAWYNKSFSFGQNTHFIFYDPSPFCVFFKRYALYLL